MKKIFCAAGLILGVLIIAMGYKFGHDFEERFHGTSTTSYSFGADYYTEQYAATKHAADNINSLGDYYQEVTEFGIKSISGFVMAFGGVVVCYFGCGLFDTLKTKKETASVVVKNETTKDISEELPEI